ncbi:hypothetical protein C0Q70_05620 [Pomacea canaliculata]|uniref:C-type lectin domain-containing protein n=1 Tax=Pomacea canaliculata TaxID=400727 RepID=A0A2T7PLQ2_POMCA|nr:hypothetical protein C0Q70_05620 [Pomacea canaliculata]
MAWAWLIVAPLVVTLTSAQFTPGCSFSNGQCLYNVQLGHLGQCDQQIASGSTAGNQCCENLQSQVNGLASDVSVLKAQVSTLMSELQSAKSNASGSQKELSEDEARIQSLLATLMQKEKELNSTQHQFSQTIQQAGDEIRSLRATVARLTSELNTCKGVLGMATGTATAAPLGHYVLLNSTRIGEKSSISHLNDLAVLTSEVFPPASGYCIRFSYNMYGKDVKELNVYAKIESGSGLGYPIFSRTGNQGQLWHLGEANLDSEYTASPFRVSTCVHGKHICLPFLCIPYQYDYNGAIAVDDIYVYNTSCGNIPRCPPNSVTRVNGSVTSCYTFHVEAVSWYDAAVACRRQGASVSLVTVQSLDEQKFLIQAIKNSTALSLAGQSGFYTGGNDERVEGMFDWTDSGTPYHTIYSNWKSGQPNNVAGDQNCLLLQYPELDFQWGDVDCDEKHPFICETKYPTPTESASSAGLIG